MSHDEGKKCLCVAEHRPAPLELNEHHIWPLGMGGPDTPDNKVWLCPTTHANVHELLRWFLRERRIISWREVLAAYEQPVSVYAYALANIGYLRVVGLP